MAHDDVFTRFEGFFTTQRIVKKVTNYPLHSTMAKK